MKLRSSATSPYVRKVRMVAIECGIELELIPTNPWAADTDLPHDNPLGKVPALVLDNGDCLFDSPVICEYLDGQHSGHKLFSAEPHDRFRSLRLQALADGILDAALAIRIENNTRPADKRWDVWVDRQQAAVNRALDVLEKEVGHWGGVFLIGSISVVCALGYLDFRKVCDWRANRPHLSHWYSAVHNRRSVRETEPVE